MLRKAELPTQPTVPINLSSDLYPNVRMERFTGTRHVGEQFYRVFFCHSHLSVLGSPEGSARRTGMLGEGQVRA